MNTMLNHKRNHSSHRIHIEKHVQKKPRIRQDRQNFMFCGSLEPDIRRVVASRMYYRRCQDVLLGLALPADLSVLPAPDHLSVLVNQAIQTVLDRLECLSVRDLQVFRVVLSPSNNTTTML